jgi:hypothetical protein
MEVATMIGGIKEQKESMILVVDARQVKSVLEENVLLLVNGVEDVAILNLVPM